MITVALARRIASEKAPAHLREDAAQEALLASWLAEQKGQPEAVAARRQVIDLTRSETKSRQVSPPQLVGIEAAGQLSGAHAISEESILRYLYEQRGWTQAKIAEFAGRSLFYVQCWMRQCGIQSRRRGYAAAAKCFCGKPSYKRKTGASRAGTRCYFHFRLDATASVKRCLQRKARNEKAIPRSSAAA